ncbi:hypothetical protein DSLASN_34850 [Desulfoluna limicola]|uniref:Resolvase/invertase-type recombinase catalytic domain-containing protein n=1 Tax=Desulfoluna limicola TaxID=2810562 RepID=A0ABM7PKX4_9BACT|nr:recombinase family protein [Desulfoluna limicola]BCS97853.1 hypothetical protein DSLASN_34850 [Desulfoluna limicola]
MKTEIKTAYAYLRVSSQSQIDGDGFRRQEEEIRAYAKRNGIEITGVFKEEGISGTKGEEDRPAFQEMMHKILANGVDAVIVEGVDRLARTLQIQEQLIAFMTSKEVNLISARTEANITEDFQADPMKKALVQIQGVFSELEKSLLVKKLSAARKAKRAESENDKCEGRKGLDETDEGRELLQVIKKHRRKPRKAKRLTYAQVAENLNAEGIKTLSGTAWTPRYLQKICLKYGV